MSQIGIGTQTSTSNPNHPPRKLKSRNDPFVKFACSRAALDGDFDGLRMNRVLFNCPWNTTTCANAALNGHLDILRWAHRNGCPWNTLTCANAALGGHLEVLRWARENGCP